MERFRVRIDNEALTFAANHFVLFASGECEPLHGHDFRVTAEVEGPLDGDHVVFDFLALRRILLAVIGELDHKAIVPTASPRIAVTTDARTVTIGCKGKTWVLPRGDCALLSLENGSSELIARWISKRLQEEIAKYARESTSRLVAPRVVRVDLEESPGQWATYETGT